MLDLLNFPYIFIILSNSPQSIISTHIHAHTHTNIYIYIYIYIYRKTWKISYFCTKNMSQIMNSHNNELINKFHNRVNNNNINSKKKECNCKSQTDCPMSGLCNLGNVVYQAIINTKEDLSDKKFYICVSSTSWKIRYGNHKFSFSHEHEKNQTALSKHYWGLKDKGLTPDIQWSILKRCSTPKSFDCRCNLCLEEKKNTFCFFLSQKNY